MPSVVNAAKVKLTHFTGASRVYDKGRRGLAAVIRGLAIDHARIKIENAQVPDITDSTGATAALVYTDLVIPTAAFDATSAGGAQTTAFNTALGKIENAGKVLVNSMNNVRARLGMPMLATASGTQAAADTVPAQDLSVTTANGTSAVDFASCVATMKLAKDNQKDLLQAMNELFIAIGEPPISLTTFTGSHQTDALLVALTAVTSAATGASSVAKTVADAFLLSHANNLASLIYHWNSDMFQTGLSDLTDNSGGTNTAVGIVANTIPSPANGAATTSSPKAGFDTQLIAIENNISDLASRMNTLRLRYNLAKYTDSTGVTPDTTIEALSVNLTAVDGSSGTVAVDQVTARARMQTIHNALSSLAVGINDLQPYFGVPLLTDTLGGVASTTLADIAATGTGVGGASGTPTLLDSDVDAWLVINRNNIAVLAQRLNAMTGTGVPTKPLSVVAA